MSLPSDMLLEVFYFCCATSISEMRVKDSQGNALHVEMKTNLKFEAQIYLASTQNYFL